MKYFALLTSSSSSCSTLASTKMMKIHLKATVLNSEDWSYANNGLSGGKGYNFQLYYMTGVEKQPKRVNVISLLAKQGKTRQNKAKQGKTRQNKAKQGKKDYIRGKGLGQ